MAYAHMNAYRGLSFVEMGLDAKQTRALNKADHVRSGQNLGRQMRWRHLVRYFDCVTKKEADL